MIETKVPMDIRKYKTKIIGPFTLRQAICVGISIFIDLMFYLFIYSSLDLSINFLIYTVIIIDIPIMAFSFDHNGIPMEKFVYGFIRNNILAPVKRTYKNSFDDEFEVNEVKLSDDSTIKKKLKNKPELKAYK